MASLPHPGNCTNCNSDFLLREKNPERWVCHDCKTVVVTRNPKPVTGVCRKCGANKADGVPFYGYSNICLQCKNEYNKEYRETNKEKISAQHRESYQLNKEKRHASVKKSIQRSPEAWIRYLVRVHMKPRGKTVTRNGYPISESRLAILRHVTITAEFMLEMWKQQNGVCALTGLKMTNTMGDMLCMSIDRKDSGVGYIPENVQLVCQFANKAKGIHSNEEALAVFQAIKNLGAK